MVPRGEGPNFVVKLNMTKNLSRKLHIQSSTQSDDFSSKDNAMNFVGQSEIEAHLPFE